MKKITLLADKPELIQEALNQYQYQLLLTEELDKAHTREFTVETLLKIVLWKVNRYPEFDKDRLNEINAFRTKPTDDRAKILLQRLLELKGFDLPMASTVLRFACPQRFQIIDKRVYRFISPNEDSLKLPRGTQKKIDFYFDYLKRLQDTCVTYNIPFQDADRILYQIDRIENADVGINY